MIKTESNSETDKLIKDLIDSDLLRFTIQFFYKTENGLRPFGTGVLVLIHETHFILTASHVADYLIEESNQLFIRVDKEKYINVIGDIKYTDIDKSQGIDLITYHRKNMQSVQLCAADEYHLKQRNKIETLFSLLKGQYNLVTSKARSIHGFLSGIYASLCAYQLTQRNKPKIQIMEPLA